MFVDDFHDVGDGADADGAVLALPEDVDEERLVGLSRQDVLLHEADVVGVDHAVVVGVAADGLKAVDGAGHPVEFGIDAVDVGRCGEIGSEGPDLAAAVVEGSGEGAVELYARRAVGGGHIYAGRC